MPESSTKESQGQSLNGAALVNHIVDKRLNQIKQWLWLVPMSSVYVAFLLIPILLLFTMSLFTGIRVGEYEFVGLDNYRRLFDSSLFYTTLRNTFVYTIANTTLTVGGGLLLALALRGAYKWIQQVFQIVFLLPYAIMSVGVAMIWQIMYRPRTGVIHAMLDRLGRDPSISFLGDATYAMPSVVTAAVWWSIGFYTVIWLVGLSSINNDYYQAAKIDGANRLQIFWHITLPLLKPIGVFLIIISVITSLRIFGLIWILTRGGPGNATEVIVTWMYQLGFIENDLGLAAALGTVLFIITLAVSAANIRLLGLGGDQR